MAQIDTEKRRGERVASVIIALTDGELSPQILTLAVHSANRARKEGAMIYCVGVKDFNATQLARIADSKRNVIPVNGGFKQLHGFIDSIIRKSCIEILSVEPNNVCAAGAFDVVVRGTGFGAKNPNQVLCSFKANGTTTLTVKPLEVYDQHLLCAAPVLQSVGESVTVQVSMNAGVSFITSSVTITSSQCADGPTLALLLPLLVSLFVALLLLWWLWPLCCTLIIKDPLVDE
ncbi:anthrax toxin receptor 1-like, partial [Lampetra planeri]